MKDFQNRSAFFYKGAIPYLFDDSGGGGMARGHSFHFIGLPCMFNSPYFDPYFPILHRF